MTAIERDKAARFWGAACHAAACTLLLGLPLGNVTGPLIVWLLKGRTTVFVDIQGKEAINFQISITMIIALPLGYLLSLLRWNPTPEGISAILPLAVLWLGGFGFYGLGMALVSAWRAARGISVRYPLTVRFFR